MKNASKQIVFTGKMDGMVDAALAPFLKEWSLRKHYVVDEPFKGGPIFRLASGLHVLEATIDEVGFNGNPEDYSAWVNAHDLAAICNLLSGLKKEIEKQAEVSISDNDSYGFRELLEQAEASRLDARNLGLDLWKSYYKEAGDSPRENGVFVARLNGEPAAFVCATPNEKGFAYLSSLFVSPAFRQRGLARRLLEHVKETFKVGRFHAYVHSENKVMENLMRSFSIDSRESSSWNDWNF